MKKYLSLLLIIFSLPYITEASVAVEVDTGIQTVNAIEGTLVLPRGASVEEIHTGNSAILIWIIKPVLNRESNTITFSGFTPGGFRGQYPLFSLSGVGVEEVKGASFTNIHSYLHDGSGTEAKVTLRLVPREVLLDEAPPEPFTPIISSSPDLFEGRDFLSFTTQDKGTGIARYEYAKTWLFNPNDSDWVEVESPKALSLLEKFKRLHIRALDHAGNERKVSTVGPYSYLTLSIGLIIIVCLALFIRRSFRSRSLPPSSYPEVS